MNRNKCSKCGGNHSSLNCPKKGMDMDAPPGDMAAPVINQIQVPIKIQNKYASEDEQNLTHSMAPIPLNPKDSTICLKCGKSGHMAVECPIGHNQINYNDKCFKCGMTGHFARDCKNQELKCHKCGITVHLVKDCPLLHNSGNENQNDMYMSSIACHKCGQKGHMARDCQNNDKSNIQKQSQIHNSSIQNERSLINRNKRD